MRKAILGVIAVLFLAGVSYAVPSGLNGTVYLSVYDGTAKTQAFYYFDLTYNSGTTNYSATAATSYASIVDGAGYEYWAGHGYGYWPGAVTAWYNSNGKLDMAGSYHNGYLLTSAGYNQTTCSDLLSINPDGTVTILNDGVTGTALTSTNGTFHALAVDSGFTTGATQGILTYQYSGGKTSAVWTYDSNAGTYTTATSAGHMFGDAGTESGATVNVGPMNQIVTSKRATGLWACTGQYSGTNILMEYKIATSDGGGFMAITDVASNVTAADIVPIPYGGSNPKILSGDTNGDGLLDVYYMGQTSTTAHPSGYRWIHCEDNTGDGLFDSAGEAWESNVPQLSGGTAELVQLPDNNADGKADWAILEWQNGSFRIYGLDSNGNYATGTSQNLTITGASTVVGSYTIVAQNMVFLPLGQDPVQAPEPGTLLLLGTGALGVVGVLRRRFMS